jgi:tripartite-type tricarboxylate transporter receptor subunit TctC
MTSAAKIAAALACVVALAGSSPVRAQDDVWPTRPVRLIAPSGPGGNPDVLARLLADKLSAAFGKPFVVENVPGAGGVVAANMVAKAAPDGHVLMFGDSGSLAINPALNPSLGYDPLKDFAPITGLVTLPTILVIHPDVQATSLAEFIALAKSQPGKMSFGSAGAGSIHHLTFAIFAERVGIELLHVPYRGGSAMVNGLLTGEIQAGWSGIPNVMELIAAGKLRGLCVSTLHRSSSTPTIRTCDELGLTGFNIATMMGLHAPVGTSPKIVGRLQAEIARSMREGAMAARMAQLGMVMEESGTAHYAAFMREDMARYEQAVGKLNLQQPK